MKAMTVKFLISMLLLAGVTLAGCSERQDEAVVSTPSATPAVTPQTGDLGAGETLFDQHCASCHPDGGNIMKPEKTLKRADLTANGLATAEAIRDYMRDPGPGMPAFGENAISDKEATNIGHYILETFK